jgi:multiple sugar transport system substrate-binding protein
MGNFAVATFKEGGMTNDTLGFMVFPEITPGIPRAEEAPTDTFHIPSGAKNKEDAKKFLAYLGSAEAQTKMNATLGQLPVNNTSTVGDDPFIKAGFEMLSSAYALAQFFDRDAPADMAKAGMEGFQEFMVKPDNLDAILERLEKVRAKVYAQ